MKNDTTPKNQSTHHILFITRVVALAVAVMGSIPQPSYAAPLPPSGIPANLQVPAGNKVFLKGYATGTQQYVCQFSGTSFTWAFFGPQATVFKENGKQILTHFLSPNPVESGTPRPTWQDSKDTSTVWAAPIPSASASVTPGAIPWLLLEVVGTQDGPTGGDNLTAATFIQRLHTSGGVAPSTGCAVANDIGKKALVPYTADYFFYTNVDDEADDRN